MHLGGERMRRELTILAGLGACGLATLVILLDMAKHMSGMGPLRTTPMGLAVALIAMPFAIGGALVAIMGAFDLYMSRDDDADEE